MRRGFKAEAERISARARTELGLDDFAPLCPWRYADHLGVVVLDFAGLALADNDRDQLVNVDPQSWSGMTIREGDTTAIVLNPVHSEARRRSTLMHEIAHALLNHVPARVDVSSTGLLLLSDYSDDQEAEADWLGAALLVPREALLLRRRLGQSVDEISEAFGVSNVLCQWRLRMTGIDRQLART